MVLKLDGTSLTVSDVVDVGRYLEPVSIEKKNRELVESSFEQLEKLVESGQTIYGVSVGCGELDKNPVAKDKKQDHQVNIVLAHACGVGEAMKPDQARAMVLCRLNNFVRGLSGVSPSLVDSMVSFLNSGIAPKVPLFGSVGSSDLVPLAHMSASLIGHGEVIVDGKIESSQAALDKLGFEKLSITGRDGLALLNGLAQTLSIASLALFDIDKLLNLSICASTMTIELLTPGVLENQINFSKYKNHETLDYLTNRLIELTNGQKSSRKRSPLSLRYSHSLSATVVDFLIESQQVLQDELNAVSDNPMIGFEGSYTNNSINTSSHRIAITLDSLATALSCACVASERRIQQLICKNPENNLPPYLTHPTQDISSNYGMMIMQYTAAALTAEVKARSQSRCIQSIPVGGLFEDLNSNVSQSALHLVWLKDVFAQLVAIELLATMQGYDCVSEEVDFGFSPLYKSIRDLVPPLKEPRVMSHDIELIQKAIEENRIKAPVVVNTFDALSQNYL